MLKGKQNGLKRATAILLTAAMMAGSLMNERGGVESVYAAAQENPSEQESAAGQENPAAQPVTGSAVELGQSEELEQPVESEQSEELEQPVGLEQPEELEQSGENPCERDAAAGFYSAVTTGAGNEQMKAKGEAIKNGTTPTVSASDTPQGSGTTYYVDAAAADNNKDGMSEQNAWKDFEKINETTFQPGDRILLKAGCEWTGVTLSPKGSGTQDSPIIISSYGEGNMPKLTGNAAVGELVSLCDQQYWDISNLDISNTAPDLKGNDNIAFNDTNGSKLQDVRGIQIAGKTSAKELHGFRLHNLYIHDVTGTCQWIGGSGTAKPGMSYGNGWDGSKRTGGIVFEILQPETAEQGATTFHDVTIDENVLIDNSFGGIILKQWMGSKVEANAPGYNVNWANGDDSKRSPCTASSNWKPHSNVTIKNNYLNHAGSGYACNTIYMTSCKESMIEHNVSDGAGTCAIELYYTDDVVIQYNEIANVVAKAGGADSNAIDPDKKATNALIQYNYSHGTGDGILLCGFIYGTSVVRYNVIQDASKRYLNPHGDRGVNYIYNNLFYNTLNQKTVTFVNTSGDGRAYNDNNKHYFYNNIFYNTNDSVQEVNIVGGKGAAYSNNCYYGTKGVQAEGDENAIFSDPCFKGGEGLGQFALKDTSPLIHAGIDADSRLEGDGLTFYTGVKSTDFFGTAIHQSAPDIGISAWTGSGTAVVKGYVTDEYGFKMAGVTVSAFAGNNETAAATGTTDAYGYYALEGLSAGTYTLRVQLNNYEDGQKQFTAVAGEAADVDLQLGACKAAIGTVTGCIKNAGGVISGAEVTLSGGSMEQAMTTQTAGDGTFTFNDVPVLLQGGYVITAQKTGYTTGSKDQVTVRPGIATEVELVLSKDVSQTNYLFNLTFDDMETGSFAGNDDWKVYGTADTKTFQIVEDTAKTGNKYLQMEKTGSGAFGFYNTSPYSLSGTITIEARVMRSSEKKSADQFGMYSYNTEDFNSGSPDTSKNPCATFALSQGNIITHNVKGNSKTAVAKAFQVNGWHIVRNVANIDTGTFDFYVDDMTTPVLRNQPLRTQKVLDYFLFFSSGTNQGNLCIDYFRVCEGAPFDYAEPALLSLKADGYTIEQNETGDFWSIREQIAKDIESISITPHAGFGSVTINGTLYNGTDPVSAALKPGENEIPVVVTAEDGKTTKEYTLKVVREDENTISYLNSLTASGVTLTPEFSKDITEYGGTTDADFIAVSYETAVAGNRVEITVNGTQCSDASKILLSDGDNVIIVKVESLDGAANLEYTMTVAKKKNNTECSHSATETVNEKAAGCVTEGYTGDQRCTECKEVVAAGTVIPALGHAYTSTVTKEPSAAETGVRTYTCSQCGDTYTEEIPKTGGSQNPSGTGGSSGSIGGSSGSTGGSSSSGTNGGSTGSSGGSGSTGSSGGSGSTGSGGSTGGNTDTSASGSFVTIDSSVQTKLDGTKVETQIEAAEDGTIRETVTETDTAGIVKETVTEKQPDGTIKKNTKKSRPDGTVKESSTEKRPDGTEMRTTAETDAAGKTTVSSVIRTGVSDKDGIVEIASDLLMDAAEKGNRKVVVEVTELTVQSGAADKKNTVAAVSIPYAENVEIEKVVLTKGSILAAKETGRTLVVKVNVNDKDNVSTDAYSVTIPAKQLAKIDSYVKEINVKVSAEPVRKVADISKKNAVAKIVKENNGNQKKTCVVNIAANKNVSAGMNVEIPVSAKTDIAKSRTVYVYKYDAKTGKLSEEAYCRKKVSVEGKVVISTVGGGDYVISAKKLSGKKVETMKDQISVAASKKEITAGGRMKINVSLPETVSVKTKFGAEKAVITYTSSNNDIASVSKAGFVRAKGSGTAVITVTVKLSSGQEITRRKTITVK